jgi:hypothetical protein
MISCTNCGTVNQPGSQFCDECGTSLKKTDSFRIDNGFDSAVNTDTEPPAPLMVEPVPVYVPPVSVPQAAPPVTDVTPQAARVQEIQQVQQIQPVYTPASATSVGVPMADEPPPPLETVLAMAAERNEAPGPNVHATLIIERGAAVGKEFSLTSDETFIGRWDADNGIFPDVDLDTHDPEAKVSRRHARVILKDGVYSVEDLGSTNGTFINRGRRLLPGNPNILNDGDELIIGKTFMRFSVKK